MSNMSEMDEIRLKLVQDFCRTFRLNLSDLEIALGQCRGVDQEKIHKAIRELRLRDKTTRT